MTAIASIYRLYIYPATVGHLPPQMSGQLFRDGELYFGIAGCEDRNGVIDAVTEQIGPDTPLEIVYLPRVNPQCIVPATEHRP